MRMSVLEFAVGLAVAFASAGSVLAQGAGFTLTRENDSLSAEGSDFTFGQGISVQTYSRPAQVPSTSTPTQPTTSVAFQGPDIQGQLNNSSTQVAPYYETVSSTSCLANSFCMFTFPAIGTGTLTNPRVNCRIVTTNISHGVQNPLTYAALGTTANAGKVFFLSSSVGAYFELGINTGTHSIYLIDQRTKFFVPAGASPTITVVTGPSNAAAIAAPNPDLDQPTCSVSGIIQ